MRYIVGRYYRAGPVKYQVGQVIEIDDPEYAAWLNRDMGGWLTPVVNPPPPPEPPPALPEPVAKPPKARRGKRP